MKAGRAARAAIKAERATIVIGQKMPRVRDAAARYGAKTYEPGKFHLPDIGLNRVKNLYNNAKWLRSHMKAGSRIVDIGANKGSTASAFYRLERIMTRFYPRRSSVYWPSIR